MDLRGLVLCYHIAQIGVFTRFLFPPCCTVHLRGLVLCYHIAQIGVFTRFLFPPCCTVPCYFARYLLDIPHGIIYINTRVTCSDECAKEQKRRLQNRAEIKRGRRKIPANEHCIHAHPSGVVGVTWCRGKWQAVWKKHYIGIYSTINEAASAIKNYIQP